MGGFFGVASKESCTRDLFYGTDYHSHLGTRRGGLATLDNGLFKRFIHNIENAQFRSKFDDDIQELTGNIGIGVISDYEDQPLLIGSHLGPYALITVGKITNLEKLCNEAFEKRTTHFSEMSGNEVNPTELVSTLINQGATFAEGITNAMNTIEGSCSMLLLTQDGIYAARDRCGRTPVILGRKNDATAVTMETCALPNLGYEVFYELGAGEIVKIDHKGIEHLKPADDKMQICSFLWVYYGYPASTYEGQNAEDVRNKCGAFLAKRDDVEVDVVAGIPDSGTAHGLGYAAESGVSYRRPFVKYTPTWPRSFMPQDQNIRQVVARMKLIQIAELVKDQRLLFCDDSIVRGTQLGDTIKQLYDKGAEEVHMRVACPPLLYGCKFLNFSRSRSELDLAARRAVVELEGTDDVDLKEYHDSTGEKYQKMVDVIRRKLNLTTLKYQTLDDLIAAIGLPKEKLCTYCWDGAECSSKDCGGCGL